MKSLIAGPGGACITVIAGLEPAQYAAQKPSIDHLAIFVNGEEITYLLVKKPNSKWNLPAVAEFLRRDNNNLHYIDVELQGESQLIVKQVKNLHTTSWVRPAWLLAIITFLAQRGEQLEDTDHSYLQQTLDLCRGIESATPSLRLDQIAQRMYVYRGNLTAEAGILNDSPPPHLIEGGADPIRWEYSPRDEEEIVKLVISRRLLIIGFNVEGLELSTGFRDFLFLVGARIHMDATLEEILFAQPWIVEP
jgi:hypothetical protein